MRIIHVSCIAPPDIGGIGRVAAIEVEALKQRGHDAVHVSLTTHAGFRLGNAGRIYALEHLLAEADVVHLHYPFYGTAGWIARARRRGLIRHLVVSLHMDATAGGPLGWLFALHRRWFQSRILKAADRLIIASKDYAQHSSFRSMIDRIEELPFGVDANVFCPGDKQPQLFDLPADKPVMLFVGGLDRAHAFKGVELLLRALIDLPDTMLILVGDGGRRGYYEKLAKQIEVFERCRFVGRLESDMLVKAYRTADLFVLPSTSAAEAFGLVVLEAQACGIPAVISNLPGLRSVVRPGETGCLAPPGDLIGLVRELKELLHHRDRLRTMGQQARQWVVDTYTWEKHMERLIDIYHSFV